MLVVYFVIMCSSTKASYVFACVLLHAAIVLGTPHFKIEVVSKPDECERLSNYGDQMFVHFVGRKVDTGEIFDQRLVALIALIRK